MGQNQSCLSSTSKTYRTDGQGRSDPVNRTTVCGETIHTTEICEHRKHPVAILESKNGATTSTEALSDDGVVDHDRNSGYNLVDLKGARMIHVEYRTLQGCEVMLGIFI